MQALLNDLKFGAAISLRGETKTVKSNINNTKDMFDKTVEMRHSPCHKSLVFVLLKLREAYLSITQVKESKKVNEVSDLYSLCSRHWKVLMDTRKNRGCKGDTQGQKELSPLSCVYITHISIIHPVLSHILFPSPC